MNIVEKLDLAIKSKEIGTTEGFYTVPYKDGTINKPTYMTNKDWNAFFQLVAVSFTILLASRFGHS